MFSSQNILLVVSIILLFYAIYRVYLLLKIISDIDRAKNWLPIQAVIKDIRLYKKNEKAGNVTFKKSYAFLYVVYTVGCRSFGMSRINFHNYVSGLAMIKLSGYVVGDAVTIYADPEKPHKAVFLKPDEHSTVYLLLMASLPLLLLAFLIVIGLQ